MIGYRMGEPEETDAKKVFRHEVKELGNKNMITDAAKVLGCKATLTEVLKAINKGWTNKAKAIWLCDTNEQADKRYGNGEPATEVHLPENAKVICDLGEEGKLYVYNDPKKKMWDITIKLVTVAETEEEAENNAWDYVNSADKSDLEFHAKVAPKNRVCPYCEGRCIHRPQKAPLQPVTDALKGLQKNIHQAMNS